MKTDDIFVVRYVSWASNVLILPWLTQNRFFLSLIARVGLAGSKSSGDVLPWRDAVSIHAVWDLRPTCTFPPVTHAKVQSGLAPALAVSYIGTDTCPQFLTLFSWPSRSVSVEAIRWKDDHGLVSLQKRCHKRQDTTHNSHQYLSTSNIIW